MYITVECYAKVGGFTYTVNADGETATVTGFNSATAEQLTDGTYRVNIDMIDGYVVTAIADGAFKGEKVRGSPKCILQIPSRRSAQNHL